MKDLEIRDYNVIDMRLAYIAGFFDGEGSITIQDKRYYNFMIRACNNVEEPIRFMHEVLGGNVFVKKPTKTRSLSFVWQCSGLPAAEVLEKLLPYLTVKRRLAHLGIALACAPVGQREDIANRIFEINRQGGKGKR